MSAAAATTASAGLVGDREIAITREFDAPRELVFEAFTDARHLAQWWGPRGFTTTTSEMDVRPGGVWRFVMHGPDGRDYVNEISYLEVVRPERLVYRQAGDAHTITFHVTVALEAAGSGTRMTWRATFASPKDRDFVVARYGAVDGMTETVARLEEHLASAAAAPKEFVVSREFDAPRDLVWKAWTENERLRQWWGPKGFTMLSCTNDLRPGGVFHYGMKAPNGSTMWGRWVYREVAPPERLVFLSSFSNERGEAVRAPFGDDWPLEIHSTVTLAERDGRTTVTLRGFAHGATEAERRMFESFFGSMQQGWAGTLDQLGEFLAQIR